MTETSDWQLIKTYTQGNAQAAFGRLVRRHLDLVYCTCLRELGDSSLAEDATQAVFLILARKARTFRPGTTLPSWLFTTALLTSKNVRRRERRRQAREQRVVAEMERTTSAEPAGWAEMEPMLNEALQSLPDAQRGLVLERFLEGRTLAEIGSTRYVSEDAARMRLNRALDRLRRWFAARNVILSAASLAALLPQAVHPAPAHCAEVLLRLAPLPAVPLASDTPAHTLAQGAIHTMNLRRLRLQLGAVALFALLSIGTTSAVRVRTQIKARVALAEKQQDQASALAVLDRMYATYAAMKSFKCHVTGRGTIGENASLAEEADYEIQRHNKIRFHRINLGDDLSDQELAVSDGSNLYVTCTGNGATANRYSKRALITSSNQPKDFKYWFVDFDQLNGVGPESDAGMPGVALGIRLHETPTPQFSALGYSLNPSTAVDIPGHMSPVPVDVVVARIPWCAGTPNRDWKGAADIVTFYIGQRDHLLYKLTYADPFSPAMWGVWTETCYSIKIDQDLPPSDFVFTPPPGSHEVQSASDLFPNGRNGRG